VFHHHLSRETSTAGLRPPPKFSTTIGPLLPSSSDYPRPSPDRRSTLWGAYQRCISRTFPPQRPSVLLAICPAHCHLRSAIRQAMSVTLVLLRISSFLIRSRRETPSIALSIALCVTLIMFVPHLITTASDTMTASLARLLTV
jgi:hypothetical protein